MHLVRLGIENFRRIAHCDIELSPGLNYFYGENAAGKTTILEAVEALSRGRSFRASQQKSLIRSGEVAFTVFGEVSHADGCHRIGIERTKLGFLARHNLEPIGKLSTLTRILPTQLFEPGSIELISGSPDQRRRQLDWGCFYYDHRFSELWIRYRKALAQRNALLRAGADGDVLVHWLDPLVQTGESLTGIRQRYLERLSASIRSTSADMLVEENWRFTLVRGWTHAKSLLEYLIEQQEGDRLCGYTRHGPHRADIQVTQDSVTIANASRGQQRQLALVWLVAQAKVFELDRGYFPILLLDDLASELDASRFGRLINYLASIDMQILLTSTRQPDDWMAAFRDSKLFHVEQGRIVEVV
ncbi:MAG: DNA replication/repair protein RecF [Thiotrichales bacterium]